MRLREVTFADDGTILGERELAPGSWVRFEARLALFWIDYACETSAAAAEEIWARQDGYGEAGYTPAQGWDWSGIRDSSAPAVADMLTTARRHVPDAVMAQLLGTTVEVVADLVGSHDH